MPSVSKKQHNAMEAAAQGKSTLGIPTAVGKEYVAADKGKKKPKKFTRLGARPGPQQTVLG